MDELLKPPFFSPNQEKCLEKSSVSAIYQLKDV